MLCPLFFLVAAQSQETTVFFQYGIETKDDEQLGMIIVISIFIYIHIYTYIYMHLYIYKHLMTQPINFNPGKMSSQVHELSHCNGTPPI